MRKHRTVAIQLLPIVVLVTCFLVAPLAGAFWGSFDGLNADFSRYVAIFKDPLYANVLFRSLKIAAVATFLCLGLGYPIAYFMTTLSRRRVALFSILLLIPLFTAFLIRTYGWMVILGRRGVLNTLLIDAGIIGVPIRILGTSLAVYIGLVHVLMPIAIFIMYAGMSQLDRSLLKASGVLGAHPVRAFLRVYFPMSVPAVISAAVLTFIVAVGFYITPVLLGGPSETMLSQLVVTQMTTLLDFQTGYALAICLIAVTVLLLFVSNFFVPVEQMWALQGSGGKPRLAFRRGPAGGASVLRSVGRRLLMAVEDGIYLIFRRPPGLFPLLAWIYFAAIVLYLLAPLVIVYVLSFSSSPFMVFPPPGFSMQWYEKFFTDVEWRAALLQSAKLAAVVASIATVIAATASFALVRGDLPAKRALFLFILAPLLLPVIVLALGLYVSISKIGLLGTFPGLVLGHLLFCAPYAVVIMVSAVRNLNRNLEYAAGTLGAPPPLVFRKVVLPALTPALITAWLMAFLQSFDELLITIFLLGRQEQTLPIKMWSDIRMQLDPTMSAASSVILTAVIVLVLATQFRSSSKTSSSGKRDPAEGSNA